MTIKSVCNKGFNSLGATPVESAKGSKNHAIIRIPRVKACIILTSLSKASFSVINQVTIDNKAANNNSGPARPPQTAEIRYNTGRSAPPYSVTNFKDEKSNMKANTRKKKGEFCANNAIKRDNFFPAF